VFLPKGTKRTKSRKGKEAAGGSGPVIGDGANPTQVLPTQTGLVNEETGEPLATFLPTEVQVDNLGEQQEEGREEEGDSSHVGDETGPGDGVEELAEPSMREVTDVVKAMGTHMLAFTHEFTPFLNLSVGQITPAQATVQATQRAARTAGTAAGVARAAAQVARTAARTVEDRATVEAEVMEIDPPARPVRRVDYLSLLAHISKQFAGSSDPIEADEWRSSLAQNFSSTRCPEEYKKDIALHFLEGDAHNWWLALDKRTNGTIERFSDFEVE